MRRLKFVVVLLGMVLILPRLASAMPPPGGLRWMLLRGLNGSVSGQAHVLFHDSSVSVNSFFSSARYTTASGISGLPAAISERKSGESLSLTLLYWAENGSRLTGLPDDGQPRLRARLADPVLLAVESTGVGEAATIGPPSSVEIYVQGSPAISDDSGAGYTGRSFPYLERNNSERPEVIMKLTWASLPTLPSGLTESLVCLPTMNSPSHIGLSREVNGTWSSLSGVSGNGCFALRSPRSTVQINSGDVALGGISAGGQSFLQFTSVNGQVFVNGQNWTRCGQFSQLPNACAATTVIGSQTLPQQLEKQFAAAKKAAQRVAIWARTNIDPSSFLSSTQNGWQNPRGEVFYSPGSVNLAAAATVSGKKLIIARGDIHLSSVTANGSGQAAFVSLEGNIHISGTRFDGAALAVSSGKAINLAGSGQLTVNGLLSAPTISLAGRTSPDSILAKLNFDARFQRGDLLGLSSIMRPLVTEPSF